MTFSQGDTVNVKSGGPALTVLSVAGDHVTCLFFSEELGEFRQAVIPSFALEAFDEDEGDDEEAHASQEHDDEDEDEDDHAHKAA
jgi:uncharacterized protein YodC (DUF2158 family)